MSVWPEFDDERLTGALLRVDLYESRYLAVREYPNVVNHLVRSAASACLLDREEDAIELIFRASARTAEWIELNDNGVVVPGFGDLAASRGLLAAAIAPESVETERAARAFVRHAEALPPGAAQNARMIAAALVGDGEAVQAAARACELSDAGLGLPLKRFLLALEVGDTAALLKIAHAWLREKMEATATNEWGAYNEVPIEVSGALALAARRGLHVKIASNRILTRFRV